MKKLLSLILLLVMSFASVSEAESYYYFQNASGMINAPEKLPFYSEGTNPSPEALSINIDSDFQFLIGETNLSIPFTTSGGNYGAGEVSYDVILNDENIVLQSSISVGGNSIAISSTEQEGQTSIQLRAIVASDTVATANFTLKVYSEAVCDSGNPLGNLDVDGDTYLIGGSAGISENALTDLLCISAYQSVVRPIGDPLAVKYRLTADVVFDSDPSTVDWNSNSAIDGVDSSGWKPLGNSSNKFIGEIDGNGYSIDNLYINRPTSDYIGLIGYANGAVVTNLELNNPTISADDYVGAIAGASTNGSMTEININNPDINSTGTVGGLVGDSENTTISSVYVKGGSIDLSGYGGYLGGLVGDHGGYQFALTDCYVTSDVSGVNAYYTGGIAGRSVGNLARVYTTGTISGPTGKAGGIAGQTYKVSHGYAISSGSGSLPLVGSLSTAYGSGISNANDLCESDSSCSLDDVITIQASWSDVIWENLMESTPRLEREVPGDIRSDGCVSDDPFDGLTQSDGYYEISTADQLVCLSNSQSTVSSVLSSSYKLVSDIDMGSSSFLTSLGWKPLGNSTTKFTGDFDGNGYAINNLYINRPTTDNIGFLGYAEGSTISDLTLNNPDVNGANQVGALLGYLKDGTATRINMNNITVDGYLKVAGIVGYSNASVLSEIYIKGGEVTSDGYHHTGGIVAKMDGGSSNLSNSYSSANVTCTQSGYVGGLVGQAQGVVSHVYSTGTVTGNSGKAGGIIGENYYATINASYAMSSGSPSLPLIGYEPSHKTNNYNALCETDSNCSASDAVTIQVEGNWSDSIWESVLVSKPVFEREAEGDVRSDKCISDDPFDGLTQSDGYYEISTADQLICLSNSQSRVPEVVTSSYKLMANIDLGNSATPSGAGWKPISTSSSKFTGDFDGNGYAINNLYINRPSADYIGFIGYADGSIIENLKFNDPVVTGQSYSAVAIGRSNAGTIRKIGIVNPTFNGYLNVGGLVGWVQDTSIYEIYVKGGSINSSGYHAMGGIIGRHRGYALTFRDSYITSDVTCTGSGYAGGVVGQTEGYLTRVYSTGKVTGASGKTGGLSGEVFKLYNSYASSSESPTNPLVANISAAYGAGLFNTTGECELDSNCSTANAIAIQSSGNWSDEIWGDITSATPALEIE